MSQEQSQKAARLLWAHWQAGTTLEALPVELQPQSRSEGYAIQAQLPAVGARSVVGWKIAATSAAGQAHIRVSGPLAGRLLSGQIDPNIDGGATLTLAGNRMRVVSREGDGSVVLGDPRAALTWLVNELSGLGITLTAGQFVTTGTCMVPLEVLPGDKARVDYGVLGRMAVNFAA